MGTDIHAVAQAKVGGAWVDIESKFDGGRHYNLFAHLAGVRNGSGFAGCDTGDAVTPIQEGRGFPDDFSLDDNGYGEYHNGEWMGDYSHGWVSASEVLSHNWQQGNHRGIITIEQYKEWDGGYPNGWCGGIGGLSVVLAECPDDITEGTTHVRVEWQRSTDEFDYFIG